MEQLSNIVEEISKIEHRATSMIQSAIDEKAILLKNHELRISEFDTNLHSKTKEQIKSIHDDLESKMKKDLDLQRAETNDLLESMQKDFDKNHSSIAQKIVASMIGA